MIELGKEDVQAIANSRFWRKQGKYIGIGFMGLLLVLFGLAILANTWHQAIYLVIPIMGLLVAGYVWVFKGVSRDMRELVKEWEEGNEKVQQI